MQNPEILKIDEIFKELKTSEKGLSINEANKRLQIYGKNVLEEEKLNKFKLFITQFQNILVYVLLAASIISIISHRLVDFFTIILLVLLNGFIGYFQELKAHVSIKALRKLTETKETVIRDNKETPISSKDLVPGDIISIEEGDIIAADIRLIKTVSLETDESSLTGESLPVIKHEKPLLKKDSLIFDQKNMLFSGTTVVKGSGLGVVINTAKKHIFQPLLKKLKKKRRNLL